MNPKGPAIFHKRLCHLLKYPMSNNQELRNTLNTLFLLLALIGLVLYFAFPAHHIIGLVVIGVGMVLKVIEFFVRFMF